MNRATAVAPVLVGLMGSGKSSIGRRLARALALELIDLDEYIVEKAGMTIPEIFASQGEEGFRDLEAAALREVLGRPAVIATGGGIVMREENRLLLKAHPPVIWLKASLKFLAKRIKGDSNRPLIASGDTRKRLRALAKIRHPLYKACADFILPRADMSKDEAMVAILDFLDTWERT